MQQLFLNEPTAARRRIPLFLFDDDSADAYAPKTGLTFSAAEIQISKNGAAEVNSAGTVVEVAGGAYYYQATLAELDTVGFISVRPVKVDVYGAPSVAQVIAINLYDAVSAGIGRLDTAVSTRLATAGYENSDALLAKPIWPGLTLLQALRGMASMLFGRVTGAGTGQERFRSNDDTTDALIITNDTAGNRTSITRNL